MDDDGGEVVLFMSSFEVEIERLDTGKTGSYRAVTLIRPVDNLPIGFSLTVGVGGGAPRRASVTHPPRMERRIVKKSIFFIIIILLVELVLLLLLCRLVDNCVSS